MEKLLRDYSLRVANFVDLGALPAQRLGDQDMTRAGLKTLAWRVLGKEVEKPKRVTMSRWDNLRLNYR